MARLRSVAHYTGRVSRPDRRFVIGGRASLVAGDGERGNFHRSARTLPATRGHAGHITFCTTPQVTALIHDSAVSLSTDLPTVSR